MHCNTGRMADDTFPGDRAAGHTPHPKTRPEAAWKP